MMITFLMMIVKARAYPTNNECFFFPREYKCRIQWYQRKYIDYYDTNWQNDSKYEIALDFDTSFGVNLIVLSHRHVFRICLIRNIALRWFQKEQTYHSCFRRTRRSTALQHDGSISLLISWSILRLLDTPISRWRSWYPSRSSHVSLISNDSTSSDYHYVSTRRTVNWSVDIKLRRDNTVYLYRNICRSRPSCNESLSITRHLRSVSVSIRDTLRIWRSASNPIAFVSSTFVFFTIRWRR